MPRGDGSIVVVGAAGVMHGGHDLSGTPSLVDAQIADDVGEQETVAGITSQTVAGGHVASDHARRCRGHILEATGRIFSRNRRRNAVAELGGVGPHRDAVGTTVESRARVVVSEISPGHTVVERHRTTDREARELNERAIPVADARVGVAIRRGRLLDSKAEIAAQRAVLGLLTGIDREEDTRTEVRVVGGRASQRTLRGFGVATDAHRHTTGASVEFGLDANCATELDAGISARDIEETSAI